MALTRRDLDASACECCGDDSSQSIYLRPSCHDDAPVVAMYDKDTGTLSLICVECDTIIAEVAVAYGM